MTTDTRIPVPHFDVALATLLEVVAESPDAPSPRQYLDDEGYPADVASTALARLDAPIAAFHGHRPHHVIALKEQGVPGTPYNQVIFPLVWDRLFVSTPQFFGMADDRVVAEDYLVYALFGHLVDPQGRGRHSVLSYSATLARGLRSFRRFLLSPSSGFLVQTRGSHGDLLQYVDELTARALASIPNESSAS